MLDRLIRSGAKKEWGRLRGVGAGGSQALGGGTRKGADYGGRGEGEKGSSCFPKEFTANGLQLSKEFKIYIRSAGT